jgi:hypothetical protein
MTDQPDTSIEPTPSAQIPQQVPVSSGGLNPARHILSRYNDLNIMAQVLLGGGWTPEFEIRQILELAQSDSPKIKLAAIKYLREVRDQALAAAGQTAQVSRTILNSDGSVTRLSSQIVAGNLPQIPDYLNQEQPMKQEQENSDDTFQSSPATETSAGIEQRESADEEIRAEQSAPLRATDPGSDPAGTTIPSLAGTGPAAAVIHRPTINFGHRNPVIISSNNRAPHN